MIGKIICPGVVSCDVLLILKVGGDALENQICVVTRLGVVRKKDGGR